MAYRRVNLLQVSACAIKSLFFAFNLLLLCACNVATSTPDAVFRHAQEGAYAAAISEDASLSVISESSGGISVWDLTNEQVKYTWRHQGEGDNTVGIVRIGSDNGFVVTADREAFALWDVTSGEPIGFWRIDESSIRDIAVSNRGRAVLVGRGSGKVMFFEPKSGRRLEFLGHQEKINSVDLSPNGHFALTGGNDYVAYLWDTRSGQVVHRFPHTSRVTKVALDKKGRYAFTADSKRGAHIWDVQSGKMLSTLSFIQRQKIFSAVRFSDDGKYLLTGSPNRRVTLWNIAEGNELQEWRVAPKQGTKPQSAVVYAVAFLPNRKVMSESSSGLAEIWSIEHK